MELHGQQQTLDQTKLINNKAITVKMVRLVLQLYQERN